ncbi:tRNA preQ1(34) S-adenosylmethionine ribosyltransferase-isomerase QueA [Fusobacterium sp. PH5-44]|uniref:tRNA preQ1(34) S-adenosylmethionine ribosyltransferase-isomerase QueA n=1 Tax=unclassified Fusobacterium TaxID=2648384 RepID=UPI003D22D35A
MSTKLIDYDYILPEELIGQCPIEPRDHSKLMVVNRNKKEISHRKFYNILDYLGENDILVRNSTKVIPARLFGKKESGGVLEILLLKRLNINLWECLVKPGKKLKIGQKIYIGNDFQLIGELIEIKDDGNRVIKFDYNGIFEDILDKLGNMPLPPYIFEKLQEKNRYQTVYALRGESVAAPTAGLHFTNELLSKIMSKGVKIVDIFLDVGLGTFRPVKEDDVLNHKMHEETFEISEDAAKIINDGKENGKRIISVGTTTTRALESATNDKGELVPFKGSTNIFIYPGFKFNVVDALITNFHLPKSTLLMLVSAFSTREFMLEVYKDAVKNKYRFFSFGDAMFIE